MWLKRAGIQIGDRIRIKEARTSGGRVYDIIVTECVRDNRYRGEILSGPNAGATVIGEMIVKETK